MTRGLSPENVTIVLVLELKEQRIICDIFNYKIIRCWIYNKTLCMLQPIYTPIT
jgi:hypothetical protein